MQSQFNEKQIKNSFPKIASFIPKIRVQKEIMEFITKWSHWQESHDIPNRYRKVFLQNPKETLEQFGI